MNSALIDGNNRKDGGPEAQSSIGDPVRERPLLHVALLVALLVSICLSLRLILLESLPAFCDELLHIAWAKRAAGFDSLGPRVENIWDSTWRHGRFLQVFLMSWLPKTAFVSLVASRAVSAVLGSSVVVALFLAGRRLGSDITGFIAAGLYIISPFALMHDRLVLADPVLSALAAWIVLLSLDLVFAPRWRWWQTIVLTGILVLSVAAKVPGALLFAYPGLALVLACRNPRRWIHGCAAMAAATAAVVPALALFVKKNAFQVAPTRSSANLLGNLAECVSWIWYYWTPPVVVAAAIAALEGLVRRRREVIVLVAWALLPVVAFAVVSSGGMLFPRYLLFGVHSGLLLVAMASTRVLARLREWSEERRYGWPKWIFAAVAVCCLWPSVGFAYRLITDPKGLDLPAIDRGQYIAGLPSGYASRESAVFLLDEVQRCPDRATVIVDNHFVRRGVDFYLSRDRSSKPFVMRERATPAKGKDWQRQLASAQEGCLFVVLAEGAVARRLRLDKQERGKVINAGTMIAEFPKPDDRIRLRLYRMDLEYLNDAGPKDDAGN